MFDRQHVGVPRRLAQELNHDIKALKRVVDQDVLLANRREAVAAMVTDPLGKTRFERFEFQLGPICRDQLGELVQAEQPGDQDDVLGLGVEAFANETAELLRHGRFELDPDYRAHAPLFEQGLKFANQILGFLFDFHVAVADQPEDALIVKVAAGKQVAEKQRDHVLQRQIPS